MKTTVTVRASLVLFTGLLVAAPIASAEKVKAVLKGIREVPAVSTPATGRFEARIDGKAGTITYEL